MQEDAETSPRNPEEFRRYRQALAGLYITVGSLGTLLLISSVVVELFFTHGERRPAPSPADLLECNREVTALLEDLGATAAEIQREAVVGRSESDLSKRWDDFSREWQRRWEAVNVRCEFDERAETDLGEAYNRMAWVHRNLPALKLKYKEMMKQFTREQAADLAEMRAALAKSRQLLEESAETPPPKN